MKRDVNIIILATMFVVIVVLAPFIITIIYENRQQAAFVNCVKKGYNRVVFDKSNSEYICYNAYTS